MLRLAGVSPADLVYDLGSGDGRVVITAAAKFGARGVGIERSAPLVAQSRASAARAGVDGRVRFLQQDLFDAELRGATVVTMYLTPDLNLKLRPALLRLKPGTRIVSHAADMGDWPPDRKTSVRKDVYLWHVPADVAGRWRSAVRLGTQESRLDLELAQRYQRVSMSARLGGAATQVWDAALAADRLTFVIVEPGEDAALYFEGRVSGDALEGTVVRGVGSAQRAAPWRAARVAR